MANRLNAEEAFACRRLAIPNEIPPVAIAQDGENEMQALIREHKGGGWRVIRDILILGLFVQSRTCAKDSSPRSSGQLSSDID